MIKQGELKMSDQSGSANPQENSVPPEKDVVKYETYSRVLNEAKKYKEKVREYETVLQQSQEQKLKEQNEWKQLAEQYKAKLEQTSKTLEEQEKAIVNGMKFQEFEKHLGGKLKKRDYASFVDFEKIVLNPETKSVDEDSVKTVVSEFVKEHSALIDFGGQPRLPNQAPQSFGPKGKSISEMSVEELKAYMIELGKQGKIK